MVLNRILVRATNWLGDGVMSLAALDAIRAAHPQAHLAVLARPSVLPLYARPGVDELIPYPRARRRDLAARLRLARALRRRRFDAAVLFQNAFDAALVAWLARIPIRIGYDRAGRRAL